QVRVVGLTNSRHMVFSEEGLNLESWKDSLEQGQPAELETFVQTAIQRNLRNSIFVDVTANDKVAAVYEKLLSRSISVVACNKIAASGPLAYYHKLKRLANDYNCSFLFETNVGAGLPVIATLND